MNKIAMCNALRSFINQRSGIDGRNYGGSREAFLGDYQPMLKHGAEARRMLNWAQESSEVTAETLQEASRAYSGRLQFVERDDKVAVDYTTGQYFPTEYRCAACAVLAQAITTALAARMPASDGKANRTIGAGTFAHEIEFKTYEGLTYRAWIVKRAAFLFGRTIAKTWFI